MVRVKKNPDVRRSEILGTARRLFGSKGIAETSVSEIVKAVGLSQGAFYWYFPSKEAILNAVVEDMAGEVCEGVAAVAASEELTALEKLSGIRKVLFEKRSASRPLLEFYHRPENKEFHDRIISAVSRRLIPAFTRVIEEGVAQGSFAVRDPADAAVFVVAAHQALHEQDFFLAGRSREARIEALFDFVLKGLGYGSHGTDRVLKGSQDGAY
ncbi:MAG: TetR/AcrR family transcriptional regulator [Candidatus Aquicultorales bacterium]